MLDGFFFFLPFFNLPQGVCGSQMELPIVLVAGSFCLGAAVPQKNTSAQNNHLWFHTMTSKRMVFSYYYLNQALRKHKKLCHGWWSGFFPGGSPPRWRKFCPSPQPTAVPAFLTRACPSQLSFVKKKITNLTSFFSQFWLLFSSKLHQKALFYTKNSAKFALILL